jgi:phage-related baseplate assembly protein
MVECRCTQCGPGSEKILLATEKLHLQRDQELKLKQNLPQSQAVSAGAYMAARRQRRQTANSSISQAGPSTAPSAYTIDADHLTIPGNIYNFLGQRFLF